MSEPSIRYDPEPQEFDCERDLAEPTSNTGPAPLALAFLFLTAVLVARGAQLLAMKLMGILGFDPRESAEVVDVE